MAGAGGLVVGGDAVAIEVADVRAAERRLGQAAERVVVDAFARQLGALAQEALALGVGRHLGEQAPVRRPPGDLFDAVDLVGLGRIGHDPYHRTCNQVAIACETHGWMILDIAMST